MNYEDDIKIDETALDVEWLNQPRLCLKYSQELAEAKKEVDQAKEKLDVIRADLDKEIRNNPKKFGMEKITEGAIQSNIVIHDLTLDSPLCNFIQSNIVIHDLFRTAETRLTEAKYKSEMIRAAVSAIEHRKDALENLVKLYGQQYFAGPKVPRDLSAEALKHAGQKKADAGIAARLKRTKVKA